MSIIPDEILLLIFDYCDVKTAQNIRVGCKKFRQVIDNINRLKCLESVKLVKCLDKQLKDFSGGVEYIISDEQPDHPATKKITSKEIEEYINIKNQVYKITNDFLETIIDALCDIDITYLNRLKLPSILLLYSSWNSVLEKAKNREKGDVFLYPNCAQITGTIRVNDTHGRKRGDYGTEGGLLASVPTWITSKKCYNWSCHRNHPFGSENIDEFLPGILFIGKKEGDVVIFPFKGKEIKLICRQLSYRYGSSPFEQVFELITSRRGGICSPEYYTPELSTEEQCAKLQHLHDTYVQSI
uniref:F-box domain protein n=1 Tax=Marseillevirus LCMAC102 TaxID=2506603 RepID=A0A481YV37_9VIRU|nr:MAG: F-box domain protein [Marseillevirus LCMAC102]